MHEDNSAALGHLCTLDAMISDLSALGFRDTVGLLKIARLDLAMRAHGIEDPEFAIALSTAELNRPPQDTPTPHKRGKVTAPHALSQVAGGVAAR